MLTGTLFRGVFDAGRAGKSLLPAILGTAASFGPPVGLILLSFAGKNLTQSPLRVGASHLLGLMIFVGGLFLLKRSPKLLLGMGAISYSFYLFHPVAAYFLIRLGVQTEMAVRNPWGFAAAFVLATAAAFAVYRLIEQPAIQLGRRLTGSRKTPDTQGGVP
jgi:peptidoglycan/LPS O-acetylase OafA/YrhL